MKLSAYIILGQNVFESEKLLKSVQTLIELPIYLLLGLRSFFFFPIVA